MTRLFIITAVKFLACKNQIQLVILEFGDLGHQTGSFGPMKLPAMFDQNPTHTFDKIVTKLRTTKSALKA